MPGLWITSANVYKDVDGDDTGLNKHFALLLLDDETKIIADIQADGGELANPLLEYLKIMKPTMSYVYFLVVKITGLIKIADSNRQPRLMVSHYQTSAS